MLARIHTSTVAGIDAFPVEVEVEASPGKACFTIIGLGDVAIRESKERVSSALKSYGFRIPDQILVNLAPAELKKEGSAFDLPIAVGILAASQQLPLEILKEMSFHGELALDGTLRRIHGAVALSAQTQKSGLRTMVVPSCNLNEARLIAGVDAIGAGTMADVIRLLKEGTLPPETQDILPFEAPPQPREPFGDVVGQKTAKRALTIAAAGGHNILMIGPPGCGKSMLAQRFAGLLPVLQHDELLEVIKIHSISGQDISSILCGLRPFRSPHHSISTAGLVGGGSFPRPGEISLAHKGVLFLDEFPEYSRSAIESLRLPLECGIVDVARARGSLRFPADFQLIAAMNPCPCGRLGVPSATCMCSPAAKQTYLKRLSQPILDRIDMHVELEGVPVAMICDSCDFQASHEEERSRPHLVDITRERQLSAGGQLNAKLKGQALRDLLKLDTRVKALIEHATQRIGLSTRALMKVLKIARTIADLEEESVLTEEHVAEALSYRCLERMERYLN